MEIEVRGLTKRYGATTALDQVSFSLPTGTVYCLFGPNGAGKSALLRILATLERPTAGRVLVLGHEITQEAQAVRRRLGFVPQSFGVQRGVTVEEHLSFFAACHGLGRRERLAAVDTMLQLVELGRWRYHEAGDLSRGLRQRLALATALVHDPEVLVLDEPFGGIDALGRGELLEVLKELRTMGKTIVLSSYGLGDVAPLCDAVGLLHLGRLVATGPPNEVLAPTANMARLVRLRIAAGADRARGVLGALPEVAELGGDESCLSFRFAGDRLAVPALLERLVEAGVQIDQFATEGPAADDALVRALQDLEV